MSDMDDSDLLLGDDFGCEACGRPNTIFDPCPECGFSLDEEDAQDIDFDEDGESL